MDHSSLVMDALSQQRNRALDQLAIRSADLAMAEARVKELEEEVAKLKEAPGE